MEDSSVATFGQFVDAVEQATGKRFDTKQAFEDWRGLVEDDLWEESRTRELTPASVITLAQEMAGHFIDLLASLEESDLRDGHCESGHYLLRDIHQIANQLGIGVGRSKIDKPLCPEDKPSKSLSASEAFQN